MRKLSLKKRFSFFHLSFFQLAKQKTKKNSLTRCRRQRKKTRKKPTLTWSAAHTKHPYNQPTNIHKTTTNTHTMTYSNQLTIWNRKLHRARCTHDDHTKYRVKFFWKVINLQKSQPRHKEFSLIRSFFFLFVCSIEVDCLFSIRIFIFYYILFG